MRLTLASVILLTGLAAAQTTAPPSQKQESDDRPVSLKRLLPNLLSDQSRIWTFPAKLAHGRDWKPTAAILGTAAALVAIDPAEAGYFHRTPVFQGFNHVFSSNATIAGTIAAPLSLYAIGLIRKDSKMQHTALLAGEAVADVEILSTVLKDLTKRARPVNIPVHGNYSDSWFEGGALFRSSGSFPSGHTITAFSIATVIARRYGNHHWVPYAAYGMAALVGFSRLSLSAHFLSDVFVGAALGYSISRFAVLQQ